MLLDYLVHKSQNLCSISNFNIMVKETLKDTNANRFHYAIHTEGNKKASN